MQDSLPVPRGDGPDNVADYVLFRRCKRHDYFTSCLPWPQKGPGVELPLGTSAPVVSNGSVISMRGSNMLGSQGNLAINSTATGPMYLAGNPTSGNPSLIFGDETGLEVDLTDASSATINSLS